MERSLVYWPSTSYVCTDHEIQTMSFSTSFILTQFDPVASGTIVTFQVCFGGDHERPHVIGSFHLS